MDAGAIADRIEPLARWLSAQDIAHGPLAEVEKLTGGTQNLLVRFRCGGEHLVLRRPPPQSRNALKTVRREAAALSALAGTPVPHPRLRGVCEDLEVFGGAFLVTDAVEGFNAAVAMPGRACSDPGFRRAMGLALVDGLAALATVDPGLPALQALGTPDNFIERQAKRWADQLQGYSQFDRWPGPGSLGPVLEIGEWLDAHRPASFQPGLMHGDYHIANVMFREADGALAAILDWELTSLGDPLLDLARLTTTWPDKNNKGLLSLKVEPWDGFPSRDELVERYATRTGRPLDDFGWYEVLACYKFAIVLEGSHARASAGLADPAVGERLHASAKGLIAKAVELTAA
jgi:aminoglycoside phosphotransferase (APT) family kinase protein